MYSCIHPLHPSDVTAYWFDEQCQEVGVGVGGGGGGLKNWKGEGKRGGRFHLTWFIFYSKNEKRRKKEENTPVYNYTSTTLCLMSLHTDLIISTRRRGGGEGGRGRGRDSLYFLPFGMIFIPERKNLKKAKCKHSTQHGNSSISLAWEWWKWGWGWGGSED